MGSGKSTTSTQAVKIPPEVMARYNAVNKRAEEAAAQPFQPYTGQFVAGLTAQQRAGMAAINNASNTAQRYYQDAARMTEAGAGPVGRLTREQIREYENPYIESVVDPTRRALEQQQGQERAMLAAQAIRSGAFGGDRAGLERANLARQQGLGMAQAISPLYSQGYQQAMQTAMGQQGIRAADLQRQLAAGQQYAGLGTGLQAAALQGAQAQIGAGTLEQQTQQADLTAQYQQFLQERGYPFQVAQFLANIAMGTGALSGSTTTTTQPTGFFSDRRLKEDAEPVGKTFDGQTIYRYKYKGDGRTQIGLMADEVQRKHPEAVGLAGGYKTVDYHEATDDAVRSKKAGGGLVGAEDLRAILEAQRAGFGPFGSGIYGGASEGSPMGKAGLGYMPTSKLPVPKLATAASMGAPRPSGLTEAASTGRNVAELMKLGREGYREGKDFLEQRRAPRPAPAGTPTPPTRPTDLPPPRPGTTTTTTRPAGGVAGIGSADAIKSADANFEGLGAMPEGMDDLSNVMMASTGGVVPRGYAAGGSINPYDPDKSNDMDYFPGEVLEDGEDKHEMLKPGQLPTPGRSGASSAMNMAGTLASFIPGVGPVIGTGMKAASMFMADGGAVDNAFAYGGLVPRKGYATDGAVEAPQFSDKDLDLMTRTMLAEAGNQGEVGQAAVGHVIRNRLNEGRYGESIPDVITRPKQFSPWNPEMVGTKNDPRLIDPESDTYKASREIARRVLAGEIEDPTKGATHFANVDVVRAQRGELQPWLRNMVDSGQTMQIGAHTFGRADAGADIPVGRPVSYEGTPTPPGLVGRSEAAPERSFDRGSTLGNVVERFTPEGFPTSSGFWAPALGFVGSMLASQRPTFGAALGEGIVGGLTAYQVERKQQADLAKSVLDIADSQFVITPDPKNPNGTRYFNKRTGNEISAAEYARAIGQIASSIGVRPGVFGSGAAPQQGEPGGVIAGPPAPQIKAIPAPSAPGAAPATGEGKPTEEKVPEWMLSPPDRVDLSNKSETQAFDYAKRWRKELGLTGEMDPDLLEAREKEQRDLAEGYRLQGNLAGAAQLRDEADKTKARRQEYLLKATAPLMETAKKAAEQRQQTNIEYFNRVADSTNARVEAITQLREIAKSLELLRPNRFAEWKSNAQGALRAVGIPIGDTEGMNIDEAQKVMKQAWTAVFTRLAAIGGQPRVIEIEGLKRSGAGIGLEPAANRKIVAEGLAALEYENRYTREALAERDRVGIANFDRAKFASEFQRKNDRTALTEEFEKNLPMRGDVPLAPNGNIDYGKLKEGYLYIIEPQFTRRAEPIKMRAVKTESGKMELEEAQ
jgi:hypothetical protein